MLVKFHKQTVSSPTAPRCIACPKDGTNRRRFVSSMTASWHGCKYDRAVDMSGVGGLTPGVKWLTPNEVVGSGRLGMDDVCFVTVKAYLFD